MRGTNATSQTNNGVAYYDGSKITTGSTLTFDGTKLTAPYASTTNVTATTASSTNLIVSSVSSGIILTDVTGKAGAYGGTTCTNQFVRSLNGAGAATCATVSLTADVTGTLGYGNGGTGTTTAPQGQLLYGGATAYQSVATSSLSVGTGLTNSGTLGYQVGGSAASISFAAIAANSLWANNTGASAVPTAISTSSLFAAGIAGNVLTYTSAGTWVPSATTTFSSGLAYSNGNVTNTGVLSNVAGSGISVSGATGNVTISNTGLLSLTQNGGGSAQTGAITLGHLIRTPTSSSTSRIPAGPLPSPPPGRARSPPRDSIPTSYRA